MYLVKCTCPNLKTAKNIASELINDELAVCCNIINGVQSMFIWEGELSEVKEAIVLIKTKKSLYNNVELKIKELHPYQCPEIFALPITVGNKTYLEWVDSL